MLVIMHFTVPFASFIGHLAGILVGYAYLWGFLAWAIPSVESFVAFETRFDCLRRTFRYVLAEAPLAQESVPNE
jgi:hypothetical protein